MRLSAVIGGVLLHVSCAAPPPDFLLITLDTVRADHTTPSGYARNTTPNLTRLGADGAVFLEAYAPCPVTAPSHLSMFSGLTPGRHGIRTNGLRIPPESMALPAALRGAGYQTAAFVSSFVLSRRFGWSEGFEHFDDVFDAAHASVPATRWEGFELPGGALDQRADTTTEKVLRWLAARPADARPIFLWVHYFDPHTPYDPPAAWRDRFAPASADPLTEWIRRYDQEIAFTDAEMGRLLDGFRRYRSGRGEALVVVASDHGEAMMEHGHVHHGLTVYEESVRVPWVVSWPGRLPAGGRRLSGPVSLVDLAPTIIGLLGLRVPGLGEEGRDLSPTLLSGAELIERRPILLQRRVFEPGASDSLFAPPWATGGTGRGIVGEGFGLRLGRWKLIEEQDSGRRELYDLEADPGERSDLSEGQRARAADLSRRLTEWRTRAAAHFVPEELDPETRRRLRALGYLP